VCNATPLLELSHSDFLLDFSTSRTQHIKFDPEDGLKNREYFEKKYGQRGEELIATLGSGLPGVLILDQQQPLVHNLCLCLLLIVTFLLVLTTNSAGFKVHLR
jgi:hypothetical protein